MRSSTLLALTAALAVAGCGGAQDAASQDTAEPVAQAEAEPAMPGDEPAAADEPAASSDPQSGTSPPADDPARSPLSSAYTELDLNTCKEIRREPEGESATWRCPGYDGVPLFVHVGDGRYDLDAGVDNKTWESIGAFNDVPGTVEWRLVNGRPSAIIYRLRDVSGMAGNRSVLMVEEVGTKDRPGCLFARIAGDTPDANRVARMHANDTFENAPCQRGKMTTIGNAT